MERIVWIDLIKVLGMYFIVLGHFFPFGDKYIYAFSVPLFFFISGYLSKYLSLKEFVNKTYKTLLLPLILLCFLSQIIDLGIELYNSDSVNIENYIKKWMSILFGNQGENYYYGGLGGCWFIYTLILLKILFNVLKKNKLHLIVIICCLLISIYLNNNEIYFYNSFTNVFLAYPYFIVGFWTNKYKILEKIKISNVTIVLAILLFFITSSFNGYLMMYKNDYGNNILLSYLAAFLGIFLCYNFCKKFEKYYNRYFHVLSMGTILILAFHGYFITLFQNINLSVLNLYLVISAYIFSVLILFLFYPITLCVGKYMPSILGGRIVSVQK